MKTFAEWLSTTFPSVYLQTHEAWMLPVIQSLHITGIGTAVGSALMMTLRLLGWVGTDQTLLETQQRFGPWLTGALLLLLASGVPADPRRAGPRTDHLFVLAENGLRRGHGRDLGRVSDIGPEDGQQWEHTLSRRRRYGWRRC